MFELEPPELVRLVAFISKPSQYRGENFGILPVKDLASKKELYSNLCRQRPAEAGMLEPSALIRRSRPSDPSNSLAPDLNITEVKCITITRRKIGTHPHTSCPKIERGLSASTNSKQIQTHRADTYASYTSRSNTGLPIQESRTTMATAQDTKAGLMSVVHFACLAPNRMEYLLHLPEDAGFIAPWTGSWLWLWLVLPTYRRLNNLKLQLLDALRLWDILRVQLDRVGAIFEPWELASAFSALVART
ncbi:hypothetical protein C8R46DRAFT_1035514 [Mycena filopes]|nr:hypothetical protein C8R46DRAFT_1035514 [Mycena filopes]